MIRGLERLPSQDRWKEMGLFILQKRRLQGTLWGPPSTCRGPTGTLGRDFLVGAGIDRMKKNSFKLEKSRFRLDIKKKNFTV